MYAEHYPAEVAGLVLVDAVHPEQNRRALALLPPERPDESAALATLRRNLRRVNDETTPWIEDMGEWVDWSASQAQARALGALGALPLIVVTQGGPVEANLPPDCPADFAAYAAQAYHPMHLELQADLARLSSRGRQVIAARSGHMIQRDEPEVVVAGIREVVEAVRRGARP
jgi:pimeloyl-ACP methyl ester carboxylesterase